jgi:hypothetical protein
LYLKNITTIGLITTPPHKNYTLNHNGMNVREINHSAASCDMKDLTALKAQRAVLNLDINRSI